jgi:hypothetical protein
MKLAILYQNDDFGKDYPAGVKDVLGDKFDKVVTTATYEVTDPTVDSQITSLQASGADVLLVAATPKFAAQAIRKVHDLNWKPMFFMTNVSISVGSVITPAGVDNAVGLVSTGYLKNPTDAGHQGKHQPYRSPAHQADAVGTVRRQDLGAVRRHHRGGFLILAPYAEPRRAVHTLGQQSGLVGQWLIARGLRDQQRVGRNTARGTQPVDRWCQQFAAIRRIQEDQAPGFT